MTSRSSGQLSNAVAILGKLALNLALIFSGGYFVPAPYCSKVNSNEILRSKSCSRHKYTLFNVWWCHDGIQEDANSSIRRLQVGVSRRKNKGLKSDYIPNGHKGIHRCVSGSFKLAFAFARVSCQEGDYISDAVLPQRADIKALTNRVYVNW